jgi:gliding motility-associated-like protein
MKERLCLVLILAGLLPLKLFAQEYPSKKPKFTITERKGCAPLTFQVTNAFCGGGASCTARFHDGRPDEPFVDGDIITYPDPGNFTFEIIAELAADNDEIDIEVLEPVQPAFEVYSCESSGVQVVITDTQFPEYIIDFKDGPEVYALAGPTPHNHTYAAPPPSIDVEVRGLPHDTPPPGNPADIRAQDGCPVSTATVNIYTGALNAILIDELRVLDDGATIELDFPAADPTVQYKLMKAADNTASGFTTFKTYYGATTDAITTLQPDNNFYCFRLDTFNPCGGNSAVSDVICSINFDVTAQNNQNAFSIQSSATGSPVYAVDRNNVPISPVSPDANVVCKTDYTYQATAEYPNNTTSISMHKTVTAFSNDVPAPIENISSVAGETSVNLLWQQPSSSIAETYIIAEVANGQNRPLMTSITPTYTDNSYTFPTDYTVTYISTCGIRSLPGTTARPMQLTGVIQKNNTIDLTWTKHRGWKDGVDHYELYEDGVLMDDVYLSASDTSFSIPDDLTTQTHTYEVWAIPDPAAVPAITNSLSNQVSFIKAPNLTYPTAFTPNSDQLNDNFKVFSLYTAGVEFKIFNRWGELMFLTTDLNSEGWDGNYKGNPMPEGTYVFTTRITDLVGRTFDRSGTVVLLRKKEAQ